MKSKKLFTMIPLVALFGIAAGVMTACGGAPKQESSETESIYVPTLNTTITLTPVEGEFDTLPSAVSDYLASEKYTEPSNTSGEKSKPNKLTLAWNAQGDEQAEKYVIQLAEDEKMEQVVRQYEVTTSSVEIDNLKVGTQYYWRVYAKKGEQENRSEIGTFKTKDSSVRLIDIDGLSNVRDCGAKDTEFGVKIKQGLLYRGEEFNQQNYAKKGSGNSLSVDYTKVSQVYEEEMAKAKPYGRKVTEKGIDQLKNEINLKVEIDVRGYETFDYADPFSKPISEISGMTEHHGCVEGIDYFINPFHTSHDKLYYDEYGKAASKKFFDIISDENNLPAYFHCAQGKDRTGFAACLFEAFLGASEEDLVRDYLMSNFGNTGSVNYSKMTTGDYNYLLWLKGEEVSTKDGVKYQATGNTISERAENYLLECGVTQDQLDNVRHIFLGI
ncbi:MAG: tyrosine-protein phosphatase [Bacilli bacterium]|nr:tyrosine-protein phosphatase [Bacilli bacterium]